MIPKDRRHLELPVTKVHFLKTFEKLSQKRDKSVRFDPLENRDVLAWIVHERLGMLAEVNRWRLINLLKEITELQLWKREQLAVGHTDYCEKFALYCAEFALGLE